MSNEPFKNFVQFISEADIQSNPAVSPEYFKSLNTRAQHNFMQLQRKYGPEMMRFMEYVHQIQAMQRGHEKELEDLAGEVIMDQFGPILGETELDIKIPQQEEIKRMMKPPKAEEPGELPTSKEIEDDETKTAIHKRKILNMIAQGEALNAKKMFTGEVADAGLKQIFGEAEGKKMLDLLIKITDFATMQDWIIPEEVAQEMWEAGDGFSGASEIKWKPPKDEDKGEEEDQEEGQDEGSDEPTEENTRPTIVVRGLDFAMLIHEAIKGIYGLINQGGLAHLSDEQIQKVFMNTDTMADEIQDLKRAKLTAADLRDFLNMFPDVLRMDNGREYVWGKMIDANVLPDMEFLKLMNLIWTSAPLYRTVGQGEPQYTEEEKAAAEQALPEAKRKVQELIDIIKKELSDWEHDVKTADYMASVGHDEDDEEDQYDTLPEPRQEIELPEPPKKELSKRDIQDLIDKALDRRDYAEVARLSQLLKETKEHENDEP